MANPAIKELTSPTPPKAQQPRPTLQQAFSHIDMPSDLAAGRNDTEKFYDFFFRDSRYPRFPWGNEIPQGGIPIEQTEGLHPIGGSGGGGGGGAPGGGGGGGWGDAWNDYAKVKGLLGTIAGQAQDKYGNLIGQYNSVKQGIGQAFNKVRKQYDKDLGGVPTLGMKLPASMGGGEVPMAPGKWSDMYSQQANTRGGLLNSKYGNVLNALAGKGNAIGGELGSELAAAGQLGDLWRGGTQYDLGLQDIGLGYANLANQMGMAQGDWANRLQLQDMRNQAGLDAQKNSDYWKQQMLNANDGGSDWIQWLPLIGKGFDWALNNSDKISSWFA
jgi:hypothetical protein